MEVWEMHNSHQLEIFQLPHQSIPLTATACEDISHFKQALFFGINTASQLCAYAKVLRQ